MKPSARYKQLIKEMEPLLVKAPKHPWLTKWIKALNSDLKEMREKRNSNALFMRFHKAYLKVGASDKDAGFDNWKKYVIDRDVDEEMVIQSVPAYGIWCKKQDRPVLNGERFLSKSAWEWVEVSEVIKRKKTCPWCHKEVKKLLYHSYRDDKGCNFSCYVCDECKNK